MDENDRLFLSMVSAIAMRNNCVISISNEEDHIIEISGSKDDEVQCALEIQQMMDDLEKAQSVLLKEE